MAVLVLGVILERGYGFVHKDRELKFLILLLAAAGIIGH